MVNHGEKGLILDEQALAAATTDDYYFPPGRPDSVGTVDVEGNEQHIVLKRILFAVEAINVKILAIGINDRSGTVTWIVGPSPSATTSLSPFVTGIPYLQFDIVHEATDVRNIMVRAHNNDAVNAKNLSMMVIYEPVD